jgi:hypothetical protein
MSEYNVNANISKVEAKLIDKLRKVQKLGWGGVEVKVAKEKIVHLRAFDDEEHEELIKLQK